MASALTFNNRTYISSSDAARTTGYTNDHISRLARQGKLAARRVGRTWYVASDSLEDFVTTQQQARETRNQEIAETRKAELKQGAIIRETSTTNASHISADDNSNRETTTEPAVEQTQTAYSHGSSYISKLAPHAAALSNISNTAYTSVAHIAHSDALKKALALAFSFVVVASGYTFAHSPFAQAFPARVADVFATISDIDTARVTNAITNTMQTAQTFSADAATPTVEFVGYTALTVYDIALGSAAERHIAMQRVVAAPHAIYEAMYESANGIAYVFTKQNRNTAIEMRDNTANVFDGFQGALTQTRDAFFGLFGGEPNTPEQDTAETVLTQEEYREVRDRLLGRQRLLAGDEEPPLERATTSVAVNTPAPVTPTQPTNPQPVIERVTERVIVETGISESELSNRLTALHASLQAQIANSTAENTTQIVNNYTNISRTNKIDQLNDIDLSDSDITNSRIGGTTGSFSQSVSISENLSVSGTLNATGGLSVGGSSTTTFAGSIAVDGDTFVIDTTNDRIGIGTSSPFAPLSVVGNIAGGSIQTTDSSATSTFAGSISISGEPIGTHSFPSWDIGVSDANPLGASFIINPENAAPDSNLLSAVVGTSTKFLVDADGDVFAKSITLSGSSNFSTTTISSLNVEGNTTLGDATSTDATYFNSRIGTSLIPTTNNTLDIGSTIDWLQWRSGYFANLLSIGNGSATTTIRGNNATSTFGGPIEATTGNLLLSGATTTNNVLLNPYGGNVGIGTTSPSVRLSVNGNGYFSGLTVAGAATTTGQTILAQNGGNVGIGTTSPSQRLSVDGNGYFTGTIFASNFDASGGSFTTSLTEGSVAFATSSGALSEDNANFIWDDTNNRLGLGTTSPVEQLSVAGRFYVGGSGTSTIESNLAVLNNLRVGNSSLLITNDTISNLSGNLTLNTSGGNNVIINPGVGNIGLGTTSPFARLSVAGDIYADGSLTLTDLTATSSVAARFFTATGANATSTFAGGLNIGSGGLLYDFVTGNVGVGTSSPSQKLSVQGSGYFANGLGVGVATTTPGVIETSGDVTVGGALTVQGSLTSSITNGQIRFLATPQGTNIDEGTVYINPQTAGVNNILLGFAVAGTEKVRIDAEGDIQLTGLLNSTQTSGINQLSGSLQVDNNVTLGSSNADTVTLNARVGSSIIPSTDITYDLGSPTNRFGNFYVATTTIDSLVAGGTATSSFVINQNNTSADTEDSSLQFERGSLTPNAILKWDSANDRFDFNDFPVRLQNSLIVDGTASSSIAGPLWVTGQSQGENLEDASLYINPGSGAANFKLFSIGVAGNERFSVDAEGDTLIQASLGIENQLFDITQDTLTINDSLKITGNEIVDSNDTTRISLGSTNTITGNLTTTGNFIAEGSGPHYFESGNVGIGTTSPDELLHVDAGNIKLKSDSDGGTGLLRLYDSTDTESGQLYASSGDLKIYSAADVLFNNIGNVGIGTTSPFAQLSVEGQGGTAFAVSDSANNTDFIIDGSGRVGIGTSNPTETLEIRGTASSSDAVISNTLTLNSITNGVLFSDANGNVTATSSLAAVHIEDAFLRNDGDTTTGNLVFEDSIKALFGTGSDASIYYNGTDFQFDSQEAGTGDFIFNNGDIGVGTSTPNPQGLAGTFVGISGQGGNIGGLNLINEAPGASSVVGDIRFINGSSPSSPLGTIRISADGATDSGRFSFRTKPTGTTPVERLVIDSDGNVGIATSSPYAQLSVEGQGGDAFAVSDSSNNTDFIINGSGQVGIGTGAPSAQLDVQSASGNTVIGINSPASAVLTLNRNSTSNSNIIQFQTNESSGFSVGTDVSDGFHIGTGDFLNQKAISVLDSGDVGVGTTSPWKRLSVSETVSDAQFSVAYDDTRFVNFQVDSVGDLIIDPQGDDVFLNDDNAWVCSGGGCPSGTPSGTGNLVVENRVGIGTSSPNASLHVSASAGASAVQLSGGTANLSPSTSGAGQGIQINTNDLANGSNAIFLSAPSGWSGNFLSANLNGAQQFRFEHDGDANFLGGLTVQNGGSPTLGTATSTFEGDIIIEGKLDVGTIDPVYTISGVKYATYGHSTIGIKEETTANFQIREYNEATGYYEHRIAFNELERGSDLWLFYQITSFGSFGRWNSLVVNLTPSFDGRVFYEKDPATSTLVIKSTKPGEVSARLVADRFDASKWPNLRPDQNGGYKGHIIEEK